MKNLKRALNYFRADTSRLAVVFLLMLASIGFNVLKPWPLAIIVDSILGNKPLPRWSVEALEHWEKPALLGVLVAAIFLLHLGQGFFSAAQNFLSIKIGLRGLTRVRNEIFSKLQQLSLRFYHGANSGDLIYRASWDTFSFQTLFQQGLITFATAFFSLLLMLIVMAQLSVSLTLVALLIVPFLILTIKFFGGKMGERTSAAQEADSKVTSLIQQSIVAMPLIQSYVSEEPEKKRFHAQTLAAQERRIFQHGSELWYWFVLAVIFGAGATVITWFGAKEVLAGKLTVGELLIFLAYLAQLYEPLNQLSHLGATVSSASAGTRRVFEILDAPEEIKEKPKAERPKSVHGNIEFENVSFGYEMEREVLHKISFAISAGESAAIIGPSGVGKTTLLNLMLRFFDPKSGRITLDGLDLRDWRLKELRAQIALVLQEPIILSATVAENIAYGKPGASRGEIEAAARAAHCDQFIEKLPQNYNTIIGDGAAHLSAGEQQRINLARAFLKDAPILLLDEPTSALDAENEVLLFESLHQLMRRRTTLMVAHRLATIRQVHKILVLENGELSEAGTHEELMTHGGYYARITTDSFQKSTELKK
ncbi:MAG: ABC transporter ATP-binding protein/permease [Verrucomicrobiota bacterium]|nr:ABC transporter ATP-binding protein/permease [Verrucomicrobiota bacterium]